MIRETAGDAAGCGTPAADRDTLWTVKVAPQSTPSGRPRHAVALLVAAWAHSVVSALPVPALLTGAELQNAGPESSRVVLAIKGTVSRVETAHLEGGRFVFDLSPVGWEGATRRERPQSGGIREYRYSQFSRDPKVVRLVVEVVEGWSCSHHLEDGGLVVSCGGPSQVTARRQTAGGPTIAVVRGVEFASPLAGLDATGLIDRSLGFSPHDLVRDGLPQFGSVRDDWKGAPRSHEGIDIYIDRVPVQAVAAGTVVGVGRGERAGMWIKIDHGSGVESVYVHVAGAKVRKGERVRRGQPIAVIDGAAGNANEPQLHFELRLDGVAVDPVPFIFALAPDDLKRTITLDYERLEGLAREREALIRDGSGSD